jgi:hypothetical protein
MASHLPNLPVSAGVAVCMGAAVVSILRLPLSAIVIATVLSTKAGSSVEPLVILGVVVALLATLALARSAAVFGSERPATPTEKPQAQTTTATPPSPMPPRTAG